MFANKNVRWAIVFAFMIALLATPKPALAMSATVAGYQDGSNCYGYQDGTNCFGNQDPSNCFDFQGSGNCNGNQGWGSYSPCQYGASCDGNQYVSNGYGPYGAPTGSTYVVRRGDTLRIIADRLGVSLTSLIAANPQIWNPNLIYAGQAISLPGFGGQPAYFQQPQSYGPPAYYQQPQSYGPAAYYQQPQSYGPPAYFQPPQNFGPDGYHHDGFHHQDNTVYYYTVQKGDSLQFVAHEFGTTTKALLALNKNLKNNAPLRVGDILLLH